MKGLYLELCNYVQLKEVLTPVSTEAVCPIALFTRENTDPLRQRVGCVKMYMSKLCLRVSII